MNLTRYVNATSDTPADRNFSTAMGSLHILTVVLTTLGNLLVITVIVRSRRLHTITSGFLLNLAISDMAAGLLLLPFAASSSLNQAWLYSDAFCSLLGYLYMLLCFASTWTLACISLERFVAITSPLKYHQRINRQRAAVVIALIWSGAVLNASLPFIEQHRNAYVFLPRYGYCLLNYSQHRVTAIITPVVAIFVPFAFMCYAYISIGRIACSHAKRKVVECNKDHCMFVAPKTKDYRAAKILAVIAGVFLVCWIPYTILSLWQASAQTNFPLYLTVTSLWLTFLSSAINPWLYSLMNRTFRKVMWSQGIRLLQTLRLMRGGDITTFNATTSNVAGKLNTINMEERGSCKDSLILEQKEPATNADDEGARDNVTETNCTGSLQEVFADNVPGTLLHYDGSQSLLHV